MKRVYERPLMTAELFEANEYVAVCWGVACDVGYAGDKNAQLTNYGGYDWSYWNGTGPNQGNGTDSIHDHTGSCSSAANNQFSVDANNNVSFYAENSDQQGSLKGGYCSYIDKDNSNSITDGDIIFWYTLSGDSKRRWNHYGTVVAADQKHPNRS